MSSLSPGMETVEEARVELKNHLNEGRTCDLCGQFAKRYDRQIHSTMARWLIGLFRLSGGDTKQYVHGTKVAGGYWGTNDFSKLKWWGLVEQMPGESDNGGRTNSMWRITEAGCKFVLGETTVPKFASVYNNTLESFSGPQVSIHDTLHDKFDYKALMAGRQ